MDPILTIKSLSARWNGATVLKNISVTINRGEVIGLIGPNGAGKTTLLRMMAKLLEPTSGAIFLDRVALTELSRRAIAEKIAIVPQAPVSGNFAFPALEIVLMGRYPHRGRFQEESREDREIACDAMKTTSTWPLAGRLVTDLSGGERQRVLVARAFAQQPRLLLLDEPTANLDLGYQLHLLRVVKRLAQTENVAVVAAIHDLQLASRFCDRLVLLKGGEVIADGQPEVVLTAERLAEAFGLIVHVAPDPLTEGLRITVLDSVGPDQPRLEPE